MIGTQKNNKTFHRLEGHQQRPQANGQGVTTDQGHVLSEAYRIAPWVEAISLRKYRCNLSKNVNANFDVHLFAFFAPFP